MQKIQVKLLQDDSGHWYAIPVNMVQSFEKDMSDSELVESGEFDSIWGDYMINGDINNIDLFVDKSRFPWLT